MHPHTVFVCIGINTYVAPEKITVPATTPNLPVLLIGFHLIDDGCRPYHVYTSSDVLHILILPRRLLKITLVSSIQMIFFQSFKVQSLSHAEVIASLHHSFD